MSSWQSGYEDHSQPIGDECLEILHTVHGSSGSVSRELGRY